MDVSTPQHLAWLARSFGRADYLPLTADDLQAISSAGQPVQYQAGAHLFRQGAPARAAFVIKQGEVELYRGKGLRKHVVARVGPGSVIGDIAMFCDQPYISSSKAVERVVAFRFERDLLLPELARHPAVCLRWLVSALNQLKETQRRLVHLMHKTVKSQVADLLLEEADGRGEVRLSQSTLAALLGASRQTVNEAIGELRRLGVVETGYRVIHVLDEDGLRRAAATS
ncbi:MAG: Crp/Fnr family transcriptional regulator [Actinomycetota bacterium]|nr:Crp/Fnr family transcriptional regulator [Actinomycetota bacterium]